MIDFDYHIHTYYSDGDFSPEEIVDRYNDNGYEIIAITDHDGVDGSKVATEYAKNKRITIVPGIEVSSKDVFGDEIHILGYGIDTDNEVLHAGIADMMMRRAKRNDRLLAVLHDMGYDITIDDLFECGGLRFVGKKTFADVLVKKGYAESIPAVFETLFSEPEIWELKKTLVPTAKAIDMIHNAGGFAVFAHPFETRKADEDKDAFRIRLAKIIKELMKEGIDGIECFHPSVSMTEAIELRDCAVANGLIVTGGSDFHGEPERNARKSYLM